MGSPIPSEPLDLTYRGLLVQFCCPGCDTEFLKDPERYLAQAETQNRVVAVALFSPVSGRRVDSPALVQDYRGVRYPFDTDAERAEFVASPELFAAAPTRESLTCPVMGTVMPNHRSAVGYVDHAGVRYYLCCDGCDQTFQQDPAQYAAKVAKAVRPVSGTAVTPASASGPLIAPTCAGCAGEARLLNPDGSLPFRWTVAYRYVAIDRVPAARHRFTLDYAVTPRLTVGLERAGGGRGDAHHGRPRRVDGIFNYLRFSDADTPILPRVNWFITPESSRHPSLMVGVISDRLSTPRGQAFFATSSKRVPGTPLTPFVSVKLNTYDGKTVFPFGVNVAVGSRGVAQVIHDGDHTHLLATYLMKQGSVSFLLARSKYPGVSWSVGF